MGVEYKVSLTRVNRIICTLTMGLAEKHEVFTQTWSKTALISARGGIQLTSIHPEAKGLTKCNCILASLDVSRCTRIMPGQATLRAGRLASIGIHKSLSKLCKMQPSSDLGNKCVAGASTRVEFLLLSSVMP